MAVYRAKEFGAKADGVTKDTAMRPNWIVAFCSHKMQRILV